jgi:glycosyltransferase involved in cell wall biosynthesis
VHVFRSYLAPVVDDVPCHVLRSIDLDEDDVASCLSQSLVRACSGQTLAARWASLEASAFDRLLALKLSSFRAITLANQEDVPRLLSRHPGLPVCSLSNCVNLPRLNTIMPRQRAAGRDILFVGSLRYLPNVDGLLWFIRYVLPRIPGARLRIVGLDPLPSLLKHARRGRVEFMGYVGNLASVYRAAALAIAPMRSGGGTRLKILEAGAHGLPVVASPQAAAGLWTTEPPWGVIAAGEHRFALACRHLLENPHEAMRLGRRGRNAVLLRHGCDRISDGWAKLFHELQEESQA